MILLSRASRDVHAGDDRSRSARRPYAGRWRRRPPTPLRTTASLALLWVLLMGITTAVKPSFFGPGTFSAISFNMCVLGVVSVGVAVLTISGGVADLSVGANATLVSLLVANGLSDGNSTLTAVSVALFAGMLFGLVNSMLVGMLGLNPIIATLAMSFVGGALIQLSFGLESVPRDSALHEFGFGRTLGLSNLLWVTLLLLLIVEAFVLWTRPGRHVVAVGGNREAAARRGVSVRAVRIGTFTFAGLCAALGGIFIAAQSDGLQPALTSGLEFRALTVVLLAGITMQGGRGRLTALLASLLLISTLPTSIVTVGLSSEWQRVFEGLALAVALAVDSTRRRRIVA